jgi:hypothetical protein
LGLLERLSLRKGENYLDPTFRLFDFSSVGRLYRGAIIFVNDLLGQMVTNDSILRSGTPIDAGSTQKSHKIVGRLYEYHTTRVLTGTVLQMISGEKLFSHILEKLKWTRCYQSQLVVLLVQLRVLLYVNGCTCFVCSQP